MELLEKHFEIALETPDGITRLRELILKLAMQGKLVEQNLKEQSAHELIEEIKKERQKLIILGKIRKQKELELIKNDETLFKLPSNWKWVKLNEFGIWKSGSTPNRSNSSFYNGNIPWVKSGEVKQGLIKETSEKISEIALEKCSVDLNPKGSVLVAMYGANIGEVGILDIEATTNQAVCACNTFSLINNKYLFNLISSLKQNFISQGAGAAQPNISREKIINTIVPLPPFEEQKRIVEKIDQLMLLCDKLEAERKRKNKLQLQINSAAINNLIKANDEISFNDAWSFIVNQFDTLYTVKQNVTVLKDVILNLAIKGKLVGQNDNDESIENYLKKIVEEKNELLKKGMMKKQASFPIKDNDFPFSIPHRWNWIRLGEIVSLLGDGIHGTPEYDINGEYYFINGNNLTDGKIEIKENTKTVSNEQFIKHKRNLNDKTVFVSINGTIGNVAFYNNEKIILGKSACYFNLVNVNKNYIKIIINSSYFLNYAFSSATGTTIKNVSLKTMRELPIPLPSLKEQERIVERVNQLFKLCNQLEKKIEQSSKKQSQLLNAVLAQV
ncbi:restriction endonuclease subunit S [Flavobacterium sp. PL02]|uniref:restriction endonuclease subunit S n=1 Tax=Flavobacterium sp. PL02 TaxID=3088354 RepID=UPI002B2228B5|nr:restriction endonuclease subunit S [Flavobacterium sp. PL02]MEA9414914.1 restriction endonuclease subunit S [Flavobacterium sp. PL02]